MQYNPYTVLGAVLAVLLFEMAQAVRSKRFTYWTLIDSIPGALVGAIATPGLASVAATDPLGSMLAGGLAALGAKAGIRALLTKPMQDAHETAVLQTSMADLAASNPDPNVTPATTMALAEQVKTATTPAEVATVVGTMVGNCPPEAKP